MMYQICTCPTEGRKEGNKYYVIAQNCPLHGNHIESVMTTTNDDREAKIKKLAEYIIYARAKDPEYFCLDEDKQIYEIAKELLK